MIARRLRLFLLLLAFRYSHADDVDRTNALIRIGVERSGGNIHEFYAMREAVRLLREQRASPFTLARLAARAPLPEDR